ncbi:hypothetical protein JZK55_09720 [Dissulfurispira thermophila]|uniref:DUF4384 domain-containing protein n=1 Tax=Dissulfurispira thermophila TaxID=2715679 RepID=A0A7G1GZY0_9BACT|nr:hypothetical protein JZK55_09720 [Dissulfurispira thermophila]
MLLVMTSMFVASISFASEKPVWVEADGEAYMSEIDTPKEVMERAKRDAQSKAIEKAVGVFIKSHTLVSNSQLAEDLVYASVRGKIEKVNIIKEGWDEKDRNIYRVTIKAHIKPVYPEKGEGISVRLSLSKADLKEGDEVKIFYKADRDCYIYLFSVAADGSVTMLMPNSINQDNFIKANKAYEFPPSKSPIHLRAMFLPDFKEKTAEERIKIIATKKKEDLIQLGFQEGMFKVYDSKSTGMISDLIKRLNQLEPDDWAEATVVYRIER